MNFPGYRGKKRVIPRRFWTQLSQRQGTETTLLKVQGKSVSHEKLQISQV